MHQLNPPTQVVPLQLEDDPFAAAAPIEWQPISGVPGLLNFDQVVLLLSFAEVLSFNRRRAVTLELGPSSFYVSTPGFPQYVFNEDAAPEAILNGNLFWMPDAQGFGCTFELDCVVDAASLQSGNVDG